MSVLLGSMKEKYKNFSAPGARPSLDDPLGLTGLTAGMGSFISSSGLGRIPAKYYLEFRYGEEIISTMVFPYDPNSIVYDRPNPIRVNYTLGGVVREVNTIRRHNISLVGRSGLGERSGYTRNGGLIYAKGESLFREMDEFFKRYIEISTQEYGIAQNLVPINPVEGRKQMTQALGGNQRKTVKLILRCLDEDLHLCVEPVNFQWSKNTMENRHDYMWRCDFVGYDYTENKRGAFTRFINATNNQINAIGGTITVATNVLSNISNDYISPVRDAIRNVGNIASSASDVLNAAGNVAVNAYGVGSDLAQVTTKFGLLGTDWENMYDAITDPSPLAVFSPFALVGEVLTNPFGIADAKAQLDASISALTVKSEPITGESDHGDSEAGKVITIINNINSLGENLRGSIPREIYDNRIQNPASLTNGVIRGEFLANEENLGLLSSANPHAGLKDRDKRTNVIIHEMKKDEDLVSLAIKYFGDSDRWIEIQQENDWRDARRNSDGNYFKPGEEIFIPLAFVPNSNPFGEEGDLIGIDLSMPNGDLTFEDGDVQLAEGDDAVFQIIRNALLTRIGELPGFEDFGLAQNQFTGNLIYGAAILRDQLISDARILDVKDLVLSVEDDTLIVDCKIRTVQGQEIPVRAAV